MSPSPSRAAVLGSPIAHSLSPVLHRAAYAEMGLDAEYSAIEVLPEDLPSFIAGLGPQWWGLSLTMPLKQAVIPLLTEASETVRTVGAANTVVIRAGRLAGHNTDVPGMVEAIRSVSDPDALARLARGAALILGSGATALSSVAAVARLGVSSVTVSARHPDRAEPVADLARRLGLAAQISTLGAHVDAREAACVVSALPGAAAASIEIDPGPGVLLDVSYEPWPGRLVPAWRAAGSPAADGLDLLLWQAVGQVRLMTGREPPVAAMRAALRAAV